MEAAKPWAQSSGYGADAGRRAARSPGPGPIAEKRQVGISLLCSSPWLHPPRGQRERGWAWPVVLGKGCKKSLIKG